MSDYVLAIEVNNSDLHKRTGVVFKLPLRCCALLIPPDKLNEVLDCGGFTYYAEHTPYLKSLIYEDEKQRRDLCQNH